MRATAKSRKRDMDPLASAILNEDTTDIYQQLEPFISKAEFRDLGAKLEFCPLHYCDIQICIDDQVHGDEVYLPDKEE